MSDPRIQLADMENVVALVGHLTQAFTNPSGTGDLFVWEATIEVRRDPGDEMDPGEPLGTLTYSEEVWDYRPAGGAS